MEANGPSCKGQAKNKEQASANLMQKFIINMLDLEAAVVKVTGDTALSLGTTASSILTLSSHSSSNHWTVASTKKGEGNP